MPPKPGVTLAQLEAQGWYLYPQAISELAAEEEITEQEVLGSIVNMDLKRVGKTCLPDDINRLASGSLKGPVVLQVQVIQDISKSSTSLAQGGGRMIMMILSDGKLTCKAAEHKRVEALHDLLLPGTKVCLSNVTIKMGVLLLESRNVQVLGGRVESLAADCEFQRKYKGVDRANKDSAMEMAPAFRTFIPGRDNLKGIPRHQGAITKPGTAPSGGPTISNAPSASDGHPASKATSVPGQSITQAALASAAVGSGKDGGKDSVKRAPVDVVPAQLTSAPHAAKAGVKLLEAMATDDSGRGGRYGGRGGGRGGGRRGRRGRYDDDDDDDGDDATMTMEEYEAKQKMKKAAALGGTDKRRQLDDDEALARALQAQLDMEEQVAEADAAVRAQGAMARGRGGRGGAPRGGARGYEGPGRGRGESAGRGHVDVGRGEGRGRADGVSGRGHTEHRGGDVGKGVGGGGGWDASESVANWGTERGGGTGSRRGRGGGMGGRGAHSEYGRGTHSGYGQELADNTRTDHHRAASGSSRANRPVSALAVNSHVQPHQPTSSAAPPPPPLMASASAAFKAMQGDSGSTSTRQNGNPSNTQNNRPGSAKQAHQRQQPPPPAQPAAPKQSQRHVPTTLALQDNVDADQQQRPKSARPVIGATKPVPGGHGLANKPTPGATAAAAPQLRAVPASASPTPTSSAPEPRPPSASVHLAPGAARVASRAVTAALGGLLPRPRSRAEQSSTSSS